MSLVTSYARGEIAPVAGQAVCAYARARASRDGVGHPAHTTIHEKQLVYTRIIL